MTHRSFCGRRLYPRQQTLYRLVFLETDLMTEYDLEVIESWRQGFLRRRDTFGVQPDIWERVDYLKRNGYRRFPHIQLVLGRRGSKGLIGGGLGCEQLAYFYSLDDWQAYYDIDRGQNGVLSVVATNQNQAQRFQFADVRRTVERCKYLQPHIATSKDHYFSIRTPADIRYIAELKAAGVTVEHEIASLTGVALSSSSSAGRGGVGFANFYDEMAHMVLGTGSVKSGEEIYTAWQPSLDQFAKDGLTFVPSSPFTKIGIFYRLYQEGSVWMPNYQGEMVQHTERSLRLDAEEEIERLTSDPEMLILQLPSWGLYEDWQRGPELIGQTIRRPVTYPPEGELPENLRMKRMEIKNPQKFRVERRGQFADVEGAYLDPLSVEAMFRPPGWRPPLEAQSQGKLYYRYRIHCDPSRTGANFALAIGHTEIAPCDRCGQMPDYAETFHPCKACLERREPFPGMHWPHVMFDMLHVWKPGESEPDEDGRRQIDYIRVMEEIARFLERYPSTTKISFDQYDSALGIAQLRQRFSPRIMVGEALVLLLGEQHLAHPAARGEPLTQLGDAQRGVILVEADLGGGGVAFQEPRDLLHHPDVVNLAPPVLVGLGFAGLPDVQHVEHDVRPVHARERLPAFQAGLTRMESLGVVGHLPAAVARRDLGVPDGQREIRAGARRVAVDSVAVVQLTLALGFQRRTPAGRAEHGLHAQRIQVGAFDVGELAAPLHAELLRVFDLHALHAQVLRQFAFRGVGDRAPDRLADQLGPALPVLVEAPAGQLQDQHLGIGGEPLDLLLGIQSQTALGLLHHLALIVGHPDAALLVEPVEDPNFREGATGHERQAVLGKLVQRWLPRGVDLLAGFHRPGAQHHVRHLVVEVGKADATTPGRRAG